MPILVDGDTKVICQGITGSAGAVHTKGCLDYGTRIVAGVTPGRGGQTDSNGLPIHQLFHKYGGFDGGIHKFTECDSVTNEELLELDCDILIPSAIARQIHSENADKIKAKLVVEGANGPTTPEADRILQDKGVLVIPDILANAGGVVTSYFEWVQDLQNFFWEESQVNERLSKIMRKAFAAVHQTMQAHKTDMRTAAMIIGVKRVADATVMRGIYP